MNNKPNLKPLITEQNDFDGCILHLSKSDDSESPRVELLHLKFSEEKPRDETLAKVLATQIVNFAIPKGKIQMVMKQSCLGDFSQLSKLNNEAMSLLIKYQSDQSHQKKADENKIKGKKTQKQNLRYTELGELASFCIANLYLEAGQVVSKMSLKTASGMPVFGYDGVHARITTNGEFELIILESKMTETAKGGTTQYATSIDKFESDDTTEANELRLAHDLGNFDVLEKNSREEALKYLDPYSAEQSSVRKRLVGTIIYKEDLYKSTLPVNDATSSKQHEENFSKNYIKQKEIFLSELKKALSSNIAHGKCRVFYLAVPVSYTHLTLPTIYSV